MPERLYIVVVLDNFGLDDFGLDDFGLDDFGLDDFGVDKGASEPIAGAFRTASEYFNRIGRATRVGTCVNRTRP